MQPIDPAPATTDAGFHALGLTAFVPKLSFQALWPGSGIEKLMMGKLEVGRIMPHDGAYRWFSFLPRMNGMSEAGEWYRASNRDTAMAALATHTVSWLADGGILG